MKKAQPEPQANFQGATLIKRYKRFLADVKLDADGREITVLCPNTGSMKACSEPGRPIMISDSGNEKRKYRHTLEMIQMGEAWVNVNTGLPNRLVAEGVASGIFPTLRGYQGQKREQKYGREGKSRIDLLLSEHDAGQPDCFVEVKNATYRSGQSVAFPDAVTTRGQKHLLELMDVVANGQRGVIFFFVGRADVDYFRPCDEVDPEYGRLLRQALAAGVEAMAWRYRFSPAGGVPDKALVIDLKE